MRDLTKILCLLLTSSFPLSSTVLAEELPFTFLETSTGEALCGEPITVDLNTPEVKSKVVQVLFSRPLGPPEISEYNLGDGAVLKVSSQMFEYTGLNGGGLGGYANMCSQLYHLSRDL